MSQHTQCCLSGRARFRACFDGADYQKEQEMSLLDSLNKLYVAMTRPKERLYIFSKDLPNNLKGYESKENLNSFFSKDKVLIFSSTSLYNSFTIATFLA